MTLWDKKGRPAAPVAPTVTPNSKVEPPDGLSGSTTPPRPEADAVVSESESGKHEVAADMRLRAEAVPDHPVAFSKGGVMAEVLRAVSPVAPTNSQTVLGGSLVVKGDLSGNEDLLIDGQLEGTLNVPDHCVTVGAKGRVKAEIRARLVVVQGTVEGKVSAREKIDLRRTANVIGDLVSASVSIEEGAYFKGSIEILREAKEETSSRIHAVAAAASSAAG